MKKIIWVVGLVVLIGAGILISRQGTGNHEIHEAHEKVERLTAEDAESSESTQSVDEPFRYLRMRC